MLRVNAEPFVWAGLSPKALRNVAIGHFPSERSRGSHAAINSELTCSTLFDGSGPHVVVASAVNLRLE